MALLGPGHPVIDEETIFRRALQYYTSNFGPDHVLTLRATHGLGQLLGERSDSDDEAEKLLRDAWEGSKATVSPLHPQALTAGCSLAYCHFTRNRLLKAADVAIKVLDHLSGVVELAAQRIRAKLLYILAASFRRLRLHETPESEAKAYKYILQETEKLFGPDNHYTLTIAEELGVIYLEQDRVGEAVELARHIARHQGQAESHRNIESRLKTGRRLGARLFENGREEAASRVFRSAIQTCNSVLYPFVYPAVLDADINIRLLSIKVDSTDDDDPLECETGIYPIDGSTYYGALSYTWGDPNDTVPIILDEQVFEITRNLHQFLLRQRKNQAQAGQSGGLIWVDAICINQRNIPERNAAVRRMKDVYGRAKLILIWLGPEENDSALAMDTLLAVYKTTEKFKERDGWTSLAEAFDENNECAQETRKHFLSDDGAALCRRRLSAVIALVRRPWWSRIWIVQECTARIDHLKKIFMCGNHWAHWSVVIVGMLYVGHHLRHDSAQDRLYAQTSGFHAMALAKQALYPMDDLFDLLRCFASFKATDPRDLVYALLGMTGDTEVTIDYGLSVSQAWTAATAHLIRTGRRGHRFNILGWAPGMMRCMLARKALEDNIELAIDPPLVTEGALDEIVTPSWVPDFRLNQSSFPPLAKELESLSESRTNCAYYAGISTDTMGDQSDIYRPVISDGVLYVQGIFIDRITRILQQPRPGDDLYVPINTLFDQAEADLRAHSIFRSWTPEHPLDPYISGGTMHNAFLHTLAADVTLSPTGKSVARGGFVDLSRQTVRPNTFSLMRVLAYTERGYMCLVPFWAEPGVEIWLFMEGQMLYLLSEPTIETGTRFLLGESYVHGLMDGEALEWLNDGHAKLETVRIA